MRLFLPAVLLVSVLSSCVSANSYRDVVSYDSKNSGLSWRSSARMKLCESSLQSVGNSCSDQIRKYHAEDELASAAALDDCINRLTKLNGAVHSKKNARNAVISCMEQSGWLAMEIMF
jgi:hypothetical protein